MIDTKELRRLAQAAKHGPDGVSLNWLKLLQDFQKEANPAVINELLDRIEAAEKERDDAKAAAKNIALKLDYLRSKLETAENAQNDWLRANAPGGWIDNLRIENEALRAEVIHIKEVEFPRKAQAVADGWRGKCERLEARIEAMEQQEPVAHVWRCDNGHIHGSCEKTLPMGAKLYALPGAQTQGEEK